jgi:sugar (pentulose or hexulose) kinase
MQLTADIFGLPTARPHTYETSGLGAAIDAAVGLKLHSGFDAAVCEMTRMGEVFQPNPQTRAIYDELYHGVYKRLYGQLQPLYQRMRQITGIGRRG